MHKLNNCFCVSLIHFSILARRGLNRLMIKKKLPQNIHAGQSGNQAGRHAMPGPPAVLSEDTKIRSCSPIRFTDSRSLIPYIPARQNCPDSCTSRICFDASEPPAASSSLTDSRYSRNAPQINWQFADIFKRQYPKVDLQIDRLLTEDNGLYCTGAATAFMNLCLHLIEQYGVHRAWPPGVQKACSLTRPGINNRPISSTISGIRSGACLSNIPA